MLKENIMKKEKVLCYVLDEKGEIIVSECGFVDYLYQDNDCKVKTHVLVRTYKNFDDWMCGRDLTSMIFPIEQVYFRKVIIED